MAVEESIKYRKRLVELVKGLKPQDIKVRSKIKRIALELAKRKQVIYGSTVTGAYTRKINPKDIDISAKNPKLAAVTLQNELKRQGIRRNIKEKYIKKIGRKIYEIGNVSYSPLTKRKMLASVIANRNKTTALQQEVLALSGTISEPTSEYRAKKDLLRLKLIGAKLKKENKKEFDEILYKLQTEAIARKYLYSERKSEKLRKQQLYININKNKVTKTYPKIKQKGFI